MSIVSAEEIRTVLGITAAPTADEDALIALIHGAAEGGVKRVLGYEPEQNTHVEFYPRRDEDTGYGLHPEAYMPGHGHNHAHGHWDTNATHAFVQRRRRGGSKIILANIPVRSITEVREDRNSPNFGQAAGAFGATTILTAGSDYYLDLDYAGIARTGILYRGSCSWPLEPGTVQATYVAGYTSDEFRGFGQPDASPIRNAVLLWAAHLFRQFVQYAKTGVGFLAGIKVEEELDRYRYKLAPGAAEKLGCLDTGSPPPDVLEALCAYSHFGLLMV